MCFLETLIGNESLLGQGLGTAQLPRSLLGGEAGALRGGFCRVQRTSGQTNLRLVLAVISERRRDSTVPARELTTVSSTLPESTLNTVTGTGEG